MDSSTNKGPSDNFDEEYKMEVPLTKTISSTSREDVRDKKTEGFDEKQMDLYSDFLDIKEFDANEPLISTQLPLDFMEEELSTKKHMLTKLKV
jgi:hypothetical protein